MPSSPRRPASPSQRTSRKRRGRPASRGRGGGADPRERLIEAGLEVFGRDGFDGANTRALARRAGVNLAAIPYYFGGKGGLYVAVAEHIADRLSEALGPALAALEAAAADPDVPREEIAARLHALVSAWVETLLGRPEAERWAQFVIREQMAPTEAFDVLYRRVMVRLHAACAALLGRLVGRPADDPEVRLRAFTLVGQVLIFRIGRHAVQRRMGWKTYGPRQREAIRRVVGDQIESLLRAPEEASG